MNALRQKKRGRAKENRKAHHGRLATEPSHAFKSALIRLGPWRGRPFLTFLDDEQAVLRETKCEDESVDLSADYKPITNQIERKVSQQEYIL